jgi:hypothetical protein
MNPSVLNGALAIYGGVPIRNERMPAWPYFSEDEISAVAEVMRSGKVNYWTGQQGRHFEREFADSCHAKHAVAVANGTVALELALRSIGIQSGDHVITSSRTFFASGSSIVMCGATPVFADVDRDSQNVTVDALRHVLTPKTRAILVVHLGGNPCDMESIVQFARERDLFLIEDCAQAQGATYRGRPVGSFGDAAAFSFCQDKIMSTLGEGGMLTTNSSELWERASAFRDHGTKYGETARPMNGNGFRWIHDSVGTNWRMTEAQAAVGRKQLLKVSSWLERRRALANILDSRLGKIPALRIPALRSHTEPAYYRFYVFVPPETLREGWNRDAILHAINDEGVPCFTGSCGELYLEKAFAAWRPSFRHPVAQELAETSLAFPVHPTLAEADVEDICSAVEKVMMYANSTAQFCSTRKRTQLDFAHR